MMHFLSWYCLDLNGEERQKVFMGFDGFIFRSFSMHQICLRHSDSGAQAATNNKWDQGWACHPTTLHTAVLNASKGGRSSCLDDNLDMTILVKFDRHANRPVNRRAGHRKATRGDEVIQSY